MRRVYVLSGLVLMASLLYFCSPNPHDPTANSPYKNVRDKNAQYVGIETCKRCHSNVYHTFIETGMGKSWDYATPSKSAAGFDGHKVLYDSLSHYYYKPYWHRDSLHVLEYRLQGKDTTYKHTERIKYIVGSGQHTNSHIWEENGHLYQAPFTFYTQKGILDLPPGFEDGHNSRFSRIISLECMGCHNALPQLAEGSDNKFLTIHTGIDCERCHGPGSIHVAEKMQGNYVDTSKEIDYTIVNPRKLPREQQVNVCMRCHLQGITVVNDDKSILDFKPSMYVSDVMNVFLPRYTNDNNGRFIMASHADRMMQSRCYKNSAMTCLNCHNPHISVKVTPTEQFNNACKNCHAQNKNCTAPIEKRKAVDDNCYSCHMRVSETMDIPHVTVHDHKISIPKDYPATKGNTTFTGLACITDAHPTNMLMADGYLQFYEAYTSVPPMLDSALIYLNKVKDKNTHYYRSFIRYYYLMKDWDNVILLSKNIDLKTCTDVYTLYRIGYSYMNKKMFTDAITWLDAATHYGALMPDVTQALGNTYAFTQQNTKAQPMFEKMIKETPSYIPAHNSLGWSYFLQNEYDKAIAQFEYSLHLDPDNETAMLNLAQVYLSQNHTDQAKTMLQRALKVNPADTRVRLILQKLNARSL